MIGRNHHKLQLPNRRNLLYGIILKVPLAKWGILFPSQLNTFRYYLQNRALDSIDYKPTAKTPIANLPIAKQVDQGANYGKEIFQAGVGDTSKAFYNTLQSVGGDNRTWE